MATVSGTTVIDNDHQITAQWSLGSADTGIPTAISRWADRTVQITGTIGGATVVLHGSNDNSTWVTLNDTSGSPLSFTANGMKIIAENPLYMRPVSSGGSGSAIVVTVRGAGGQ